TVKTAPQIKTVMATGKQSVPATQARGEVTFYNSDVVSHFIPAGSTIAVPHSGLLVATDIDVTVAAGVPPEEGHASVQSHVVQAGAADNIAAGSLHYTVCCSSPYIRVNNLMAFTGGQDAHTYAVVQQSDIDGAALALASMQKQSAPDLLRSQAKPHEQLAVPSVSCTPVVNPGAAAGSNATSVTV